MSGELRFYLAYGFYCSEQSSESTKVTGNLQKSDKMQIEFCLVVMQIISVH